METATWDRLRAVATAHRALQMVVLHGSRARSEQHARSDWDLAYLADDGLDHLALLDDLAAQLHTDAVDLVDLRRASGLLRFRVARDGRVIYERDEGAFRDFAITAALFWCDIEPVARRAHAAVLAGLG